MAYNLAQKLIKITLEIKMCLLGLCLMIFTDQHNQFSKACINEVKLILPHTNGIAEHLSAALEL